MDKPFYSDLSTLPDDDGTLPEERDQMDAVVELDAEELEGIEDEGEQRQVGTSDFDDNLAEELDAKDSAGLGMTLRQFVEADLESRQGWERKLMAGMEIIGLEDVPSDSTAFDGAAMVNHPALAEAMVQFQARAMEELLPPTGPVKCIVLGQSTPEREEQRERVEDFMNYQLTEEDDEYYWDTDAMLFYLPFAGSAFKKVAVSPLTGTTRSRFIHAEDFIVPYSAKSLGGASRYTHRYTMSRNDYLRAVDNGYFIDADLPTSQGSGTEDDEHRELEDTSDDREQTYHQDDVVYTLCETHIDWEFDWETEGGKTSYKKPYAITWEWETGKVVRVVRIWDEKDPKCKRECWFVHEKYLPGLGFYGFGLLHIIGSLGRAASGALRAVLDGSLTASLQGGFKSRDARMAAEELAKSFYTPPFKEPSPALFKTLEMIINSIQRFSSTTEAMVGDASNTGPVGTTVALIEQGSKVFSGIHKRLHLAARQEFKLIAKSNSRYMEEDEYPYQTGDTEKRVLREDFDGRVDIVPVSDPNIFSSVQRIAIAQAVTQAVSENPDIFDRDDKVRAYKSLLKALKTPDAEEYLKGGAKKRLDPVSENQVLMTGGGANSYPEQDHAAHLAIHMHGLQTMMVQAAGDPDAEQRIMAMKAHIAEHQAWQYRLERSAELQQAVGVPLPPFDPSDTSSYEELPQDIENAIAVATAQALTPPPQPPEDGEEAGADAAAAREEDRKDMAAAREQERQDLKQRAELKRDGILTEEDDIEDGFREPPLIGA
jgi:chaperonin GroES